MDILCEVGRGGYFIDYIFSQAMTVLSSFDVTERFFNVYSNPPLQFLYIHHGRCNLPVISCKRFLFF